jgi:Heat induced stress protein YflT domain
MIDHDVVGKTHEAILIAVYDDEARTQRAVERLSEKGFPLDMLSMFGRAHPSGDDVLGIYYTSAGERMKAWAKQGALWGAVWGMLTGAAAFFVLPGIGPVLAAGPIVEAFISSLSGGVVGAAVGGAVGGAAMTGAAAATHLATVMHRMGIPREELEHLHGAIEDGHYVLLLRDATDQVQQWKTVLGLSGAKEMLDLPYTSIRDLG